MLTRAALVLLIAIVSCSASGAEQTSEEDAVRRQLAAYGEARQRGDGKAQAASYAEDAEVWNSSKRAVIRGRSAIAHELDRLPDPNRRFRLEVLNVSFCKPDIAFVDALYYGAATEPSGHAFYVMVKRDGTWLIRALRTSRFLPAAAR